ncbi:MAG: hypothetical protein WBC97_04865 [Gemmatimonadales bacterium]
MNRPSTLFDTAPPGAAAIEPHSAMLDRSAAAHLAGDEIEARQALGAYLLLRVIDRIVGLQRVDTPEDRDGLRFQLASVTRFIEDLPKVEHVEANHLAGLAKVLGVFDKDGERRLRIGLLAYSWHLEQAGHLEEALDVLGLSEPFYRESGPDELTNLGMTAGRFHRTLAHWDQADSAYQLGYESAEVRHDRRGMLLARLGRAKVVLGRGNLPESRRQIEAIIAEADGKDLAEARAWGYADLAVVLERQDLPWDGLRANYFAFQHLRDSQDRARVLSSLGVSLRAVGAFGAAKTALESVLRSTTNSYLTSNAKVELMGLGADLNDEVMFVRFWRAAGEHASAMAPSLGVDYRFQAAHGLAKFDRRNSAARWFKDARELAERNNLNEWYFRIVQAEAMQPIETALEVDRSVPSLATGHEPTVDEIEKGLRHYAEALVGEP